MAGPIKNKRHPTKEIREGVQEILDKANALAKIDRQIKKDQYQLDGLSVKHDKNGVSIFLTISSDRSIGVSILKPMIDSGFHPQQTYAGGSTEGVRMMITFRGYSDEIGFVSLPDPKKDFKAYINRINWEKFTSIVRR